MLNISVINPYIRVAMHSVIPANHEINRRIIFDYELIYIADGEFIFNYNDIDYLCKSGQFIFIRPGVSHSFSGINNNLTQPHIHFDITHISNSEQVPVSFKDTDVLTEKEISYIREDIFYEYPKTPFVSFSDKEHALSLFYEIVGQTNISALCRKAKLIELIGLLISDNFRKLFEQENRFLSVEKHVKAYLDSNQGFTAKLEDLAKQFNYSKYYLDHRFQKRYGVGIMAYRNEKRMQAAKEMLKYNSVSVVSEKLGFSSIYVFSRAFKNHFGVSPTLLAKAE